MNAPATLAAVVGHPSALEVFTQALFDRHQVQNGLKPRWSTIKEATRIHWRQSVAQAADSAWRSQFSPHARERILNAPDPYRIFAIGLARQLGAARSRARSPRGLQRAIRSAGGEAFGAWQEAIQAGAMAVTFARGDSAGGDRTMLLEALPGLKDSA